MPTWTGVDCPWHSYSKVLSWSILGVLEPLSACGAGVGQMWGTCAHAALLQRAEKRLVDDGTFNERVFPRHGCF